MTSRILRIETADGETPTADDTAIERDSKVDDFSSLISLKRESFNFLNAKATFTTGRGDEDGDDRSGTRKVDVVVPDVVEVADDVPEAVDDAVDITLIVALGEVLNDEVVDALCEESGVELPENELE